MQLPVKAPVGLSFDLPDLLMAGAWADFHDLRMGIELDVCVDGDEYEEFVGLGEQNRPFRRWMIWRSCDGIVVQPAMRRAKLFDTMAEALEQIIPTRD